MNKPLPLIELQRNFTNCLFDKSLQANHLPLNDATKSTNDQRLDIYRNNVFYSLKNALADLYPVFKRLTGEEFFNGAGLAYLNKYPPEQASMVNFGKTFPEFLEDFEYASNYIWLADVTKLELAWHQAYHETDTVSLDPADLAHTPPQELADMKIHLLPSLRLMNSKYPIYKIWLANQEGADNDETIDLDAGGELICIFRPQYEVIIKVLSVGAYAFLSNLQQGQTLGDAIISATESDPEFAAEKVLSDCLSENLFEKLIEVN